MTIFVRSNPSAPWFVDTPLARETGRESRIAALRTAIGRDCYRVDAEAIASSLIAALTEHAGLAGKRH